MHKKLDLANPSPGCAGMTLIEITITLTLLVVGFAGVCALQVANSRSRSQSVEESQVTHAMRAVVEQIRGTSFSNIVATHQGQVYPVSALPSCNATITVLVNETDNSAEAQSLGLPRDLDGDGAATTVNVTGDYQLLPIKINLAWINENGSQSRDFFLFMTED